MAFIFVVVAGILLFWGVNLSIGAFFTDNMEANKRVALYQRLGSLALILAALLLVALVV